MTTKKDYWVLYDKKKHQVVRLKDSKKLLVMEYVIQAEKYRSKHLNDSFGRRYNVKKLRENPHPKQK